MLTHLIPKLPMRSKDATKGFYIAQLGFQVVGTVEHDAYLMLEKDGVEIHFFEHKELDPNQNYGQVYVRTDNIHSLYQSITDNKVRIHPNGALQLKPWGQKEFSLLDPDNNLLTFGQRG